MSVGISNVKSSGGGRYRTMTRFHWPTPHKLGAGLYAIWESEVRAAEIGRIEPFPERTVTLDVRIDADTPAIELLTLLAWVHKALCAIGALSGPDHLITSMAIEMSRDIGGGMEVTLWGADAV